MRASQESRFREFAEQVRPWLHRVATAMTADPHAADDVVQECLVKAYVHWRRVSGADDPRAYVRRILVRCVLDAARSPRRREVPVAAVGDRAVLSDPLAAVEARGPLVDALGALTDRQRQVIVLRFVEDLGVDAVADLLGIAPGTVKSTTSQAISALRVQLEGAAR